MPAIHRTTSAPVTSDRIGKETPAAPLRRKPWLLRHDISSQDINISLSESLQPSDTSTSKPFPERSTSTPNIGSVVMNNSKGIAAMLGKRPGESLAKASTKKKVTKVTAKKDVVKMVPEADRVFAGKTMYWIPDDDIDQGRKMRMDKAREYGGVWSKNVSCTALKFILLQWPLMAVANGSDYLGPSSIFVIRDKPILCARVT